MNRLGWRPAAYAGSLLLTTLLELSVYLGLQELYSNLKKLAIDLDVSLQIAYPIPQAL